MTAAIADALLAHGTSTGEAEFSQALSTWGHRYLERGFGSGLRSWLTSGGTEGTGSWGNGACMRISPVAWLAQDDVSARNLAELACKPTHDHEDAILSAKAVVRAIREGKGRTDARHVAAIAQEEFGVSLKPFEFRPRELQKGSLKAKTSTLWAFSALMEATGFESALRRAIAFNKDTDTAGAIAGAIAEAVWGVPSLLWNEAAGRLSFDILNVVDRFEARLKNQA